MKTVHTITMAIERLQARRAAANAKFDELQHALEKESAAIIAHERKALIERWRVAQQMYGLTVADLKAPTKGTKPAKQVTTKRKSAPRPPKYRDPDTGETWAGYGNTAVWLRERIKGGAKKEDFAIDENGNIKAKAHKRTTNGSGATHASA